jgi:hypothetical protein
MENMREHEGHEAVPACPGNNLFCTGPGLTKQILEGTFWQKCLMLPHNPHVFVSCLTIEGENMRIMRVDEGGIFNGFYLFRVEMGVYGDPKHEANMREHEGVPHVLAGNMEAGMNKSDMEEKARHEADDEARHLMRVMVVIEASFVVALVCITAFVLNILLR